MTKEERIIILQITELKTRIENIEFGIFEILKKMGYYGNEELQVEKEELQKRFSGVLIGLFLIYFLKGGFFSYGIYELFKK